MDAGAIPVDAGAIPDQDAGPASSQGATRGGGDAGGGVANISPAANGGSMSMEPAAEDAGVEPSRKTTVAGASAPASLVPRLAHAFAEWSVPVALPGARVAPSYAVEGATVLDEVTGLRWQRQPPAVYPGCNQKHFDDEEVGARCDWTGAARYCESPELAAALGGGTWRLPTLIEVESVFDETRAPTFDEAFVTRHNDFFWSISPCIQSYDRTSTRGWAVDFSSGYNQCSDKSKAGRVRCVSGGTPGAGQEPAYEISADVVRDTRTGLTWQRSLNARSFSFREAADYCRGLELAGGGFRVPALKELLTLVDSRRFDPAIDATAFPNTPAVPHWTASPFLQEGLQAYHVDFSLGQLDYDGSLDDTHRVRCVR